VLITTTPKLVGEVDLPVCCDTLQRTAATAGTQAGGYQAYPSTCLPRFAENPFASCVALNGTLSWATFAGRGPVGNDGLGGPASNASLSVPRGLSLTSDGLYIADSGNYVVKAVNFTSAQPLITPVFPSSAWPDAPALQHTVRSVLATDLHPEYSMLMADASRSVIWGIGRGDLASIRVVAGVPGLAGFTADSLAPTETMLNGPVDVVWVAETSTYYISDHINARIRTFTSQIPGNSAGGTNVSTLAGSGNLPSSCADASRNTVAISPGALLYLHDANRTWLVVADQATRCIRVIDLADPSALVFRLAGVMADLGAPVGTLSPALTFFLGVPYALTYDAAASALIVSTSKPSSFLAVVYLPVAGAGPENATAIALPRTPADGGPMCPAQGAAYFAATGTLFASSACNTTTNFVYNVTCTPPDSAFGQPTASPTATALPSISVTSTPSSAPSGSATSSHSANPTPSASATQQPSNVSLSAREWSVTCR